MALLTRISDTPCGLFLPGPPHAQPEHLLRAKLWASRGTGTHTGAAGAGCGKLKARPGSLATFQVLGLVL